MHPGIFALLSPTGRVPSMSRYPAVLSFATPPAVEDSCGERAAVADNFL